MFAEDLLLRIRRRGHAMEDAFFTVSYSPVPDETSTTGIGGILITAVETTKRVAAERALRDVETELARVQEIGQVGGVEVDLADSLRTRRSPEYLRIHGLPTGYGKRHARGLGAAHPSGRSGTRRFATLLSRSTVSGRNTRRIPHHSPERRTGPLDSRPSGD
jgi:hypothetical protein